jgi:hypothetical protein
MIFRTYINKNNTLIEDQYTNTGLNPITELVYGGFNSGNTSNIYSRFLLHFDLSYLISQYNDGNLGDLSQVTHTLKMYNSQAFEADLKGAMTFDNKRRASSFDLVMWKIDQEWDEGNGYDYYCYNVLNQLACKNYKETYSNWYFAQNLSPWTNFGTASGSTTGITIATQHFDHGNENLSMDITSIINDMITGGSQNYGFTIAYSYEFEQKQTKELNYVGFFTRHTQTYFEPFLETNYESYILDDRNLFFTDKLNRLYLYTNLGNNPTNLDFNPSVTILDNNGDIFLSIPSSGVTRQFEGVYYVEFNVPSSAYTDCFTFQDVWSNISINGSARPDVTLEFALKKSEEWFNFGDNDGEPKQYGFSMSGVKREEKIKRGDIRKILVSARIPYTVDRKQVIDGLKYRLYVKQGTAEINVIDWDDVNRTNNQNYFLLDTSWMIPNTYYLDLKLYSNQEVRDYPEITKFYIVNQIYP